MEYLRRWRAPLGWLTLRSDGTALTGLSFDGQRYAPGAPNAEAVWAECPALAETERWLTVYFSGGVPDFTPPLSLAGSAFRRAVWSLLLQIPYGKTVSYGALAAELARQRGLSRMSAQAVGGAVGHNPVALIVPCHRVVGADGSLTGYAAGLDKKRRLRTAPHIPGEGVGRRAMM